MENLLNIIVCGDSRSGLKSSLNGVDWAACGFNLLSFSNDAQEVIEFIKDGQSLDLLITDVHAGSRNGLELIEKVNELSSETKSILVSGHPDFSAAKRGIELGIEALMMKPINKDRFIRALNDVRIKIQRQKDVVLKNDNLIDWIRNNDLSKLRNELKNYENPIFLVSNGAEIESEIDLKPCQYGQLTSSTWVYLVDHAWIFDQSYKYSESLKGIGIQEINKRNDNYKLKLMNAYKLSWQFFMSPTKQGPKITYRDAHPDNLFWFYQRVGDIYYAMLSLMNNAISLNNAENIIDATFEEFENMDTNTLTIKEAFNVHSLFLIKQKELYDEQSFSWVLGLDVYESFCNKYLNLYNLLRIVRSSIKDSCANIVKSEFSNNQASAGESLLEYIREHFREPVDLVSASNAVGYSDSYASEKLRELTGMNFTEYLTYIRMKEAISLLDNTDLSVNEISYLVGYQDPSYFRRIFKKNMETTPSEFRERPDSINERKEDSK